MEPAASASRPACEAVDGGEHDSARCVSGASASSGDVMNSSTSNTSSSGRGGVDDADGSGGGDADDDAAAAAAANNSSSGTSCCWICLVEGPGEDGAPLVQPCKCPRACHQTCMARWQLTCAGKDEERRCRFCGARLPDWRAALTPAALDAARPSVMSIRFRGAVHRVEYTPGPGGREAFLEALSSLGIRVGASSAVTFVCRTPDTGAPVALRGLAAFEAAAYCASVAAAKRARRGEEAAAAANAAAVANAAAAAASGGGGWRGGAREPRPSSSSAAGEDLGVVAGGGGAGADGMATCADDGAGDTEVAAAAGAASAAAAAAGAAQPPPPRPPPARVVLQPTLRQKLALLLRAPGRPLRALRRAAAACTRADVV